MTVYSRCVLETIGVPEDDVFVTVGCLDDYGRVMISACICLVDTEEGFKEAIGTLDHTCFCGRRHRDISAGLVAHGWKAMRRRRE